MSTSFRKRHYNKLYLTNDKQKIDPADVDKNYSNSRTEILKNEIDKFAPDIIVLLTKDAENYEKDVRDIAEKKDIPFYNIYHPSYIGRWTNEVRKIYLDVVFSYILSGESVKTSIYFPIGESSEADRQTKRKKTGKQSAVSVSTSKQKTKTKQAKNGSSTVVTSTPPGSPFWTMVVSTLKSRYGITAKAYDRNYINIATKAGSQPKSHFDILAKYDVRNKTVRVLLEGCNVGEDGKNDVNNYITSYGLTSRSDQSQGSKNLNTWYFYDKSIDVRIGITFSQADADWVADKINEFYQEFHPFLKK